LSKLRVHEIAKEINVPSKDLVEKLQAKGFDVKNHMSTLSEKEVGTIKEIFTEKKETTQVFKTS
jgi:translation initiation factor IF-2